MRAAGRALMVIAALLLLGTAGLHASGCKMVAGWLEDLPRQQSQGLQLIWLTDSLSWAVTAALWLITAWRLDRSWRGASILLSAIPLLTGLGILFIEPAFFGGYLLVVSALMAVAGVMFTRSARDAVG